MPDHGLNRQFLHVYTWLGKLTNGSDIAPGNYTYVDQSPRNDVDEWLLTSLECEWRLCFLLAIRMRQTTGTRPSCQRS
jgi:hypothetical protein